MLEIIGWLILTIFGLMLLAILFIEIIFAGVETWSRSYKFELFIFFLNLAIWYFIITLCPFTVGVK